MTATFPTLHSPSEPAPPAPGREGLARAFAAVRAETLARAAPLSAEDQCAQSMPDASPTKWHLAHTSWFFEALVLLPHVPGYKPFDADYLYLFNSYYEALGARHPRPQRGVLTRPALAEVLAYRAHVDRAVQALIDGADAPAWERVASVLTLGLHHEQQHQELIVTDALHLLLANPLLPTYGLNLPAAAPAPAGAARWLVHAGGPAEIGHAGGGFAFDNETPRHRVWLAPFEIADRLVTQADYAAFVADGGYRRPALWLSAGWDLVQAQGWQAPPCWLAADDPRLRRHAAVTPGVDGWRVFGHQGVGPLEPQAPVGPLSFFEAAAYAEWAGARLPTEFEWEVACRLPGFAQATGHLWQWTRSSYDPYPGFRPIEGPAAEYNGKFMVGQIVLRGGSSATPAGHTRPSYRNFFPPAARWQLTGLRLAKDL